MTGNIYANGNNAYAFGNYNGISTTATPGTYQTQYIPYQRQLYIQGATFWRRFKPPVFGARFTAIPDDLRAKLQRNTGAFVAVVIDDSPAFKANVMRGDVITQIDDKQITNDKNLVDLLTSLAGKRTSFKIIRGDKTLTLDIQLNEKL